MGNPWKALVALVDVELIQMPEFWNLIRNENEGRGT